VPTLIGIQQGQFVYSCNCGWIDYGHANPTRAGQIMTLLDARPAAPANVEVRSDRMAYWLSIDIPFPLDVGLMAVARTGLGSGERSRVALGMHMGREETREWLQFLAPWAGTSFSEEDLASDLLGFYMALNDIGDARFDEAAWQWLGHRCNYPLDRDEAIRWSSRVFTGYPAYEKVTEWGAPRLICTPQIDVRCPETRGWPAEFNTVTPEPASHTGNWWWYGPVYAEGPVFPSQVQDVYFILDGEGNR